MRKCLIVGTFLLGLLIQYGISAEDEACWVGLIKNIDGEVYEYEYNGNHVGPITETEPSYPDGNSWFSLNYNENFEDGEKKGMV